ncbi:MAG: PD40 domain-containing protein, partial [Candidatus Parcubacteria bacterium]|nr:PD40 domain-containing protein [Leptolyngbyaceae cyanobacterium LF-bin-113]
LRRPSISPDGRYVTFESSTRGQWDIEVLDRGAFVELDIPNDRPTNSPTTAP